MGGPHIVAASAYPGPAAFFSRHLGALPRGGGEITNAAVAMFLGNSGFVSAAIALNTALFSVCASAPVYNRRREVEFARQNFGVCRGDFRIKYPIWRPLVFDPPKNTTSGSVFFALLLNSIHIPPAEI